MGDDAVAHDGRLSDPSDEPGDGPDTAVSDTPAASDETEVTEVSDDTDASEATDASEVTDDTDATEEAGDETAAAEAPATRGRHSFPKEPRKKMSVVAATLVGGLVLVLALGATAGWLGYRVYQNHKAEQLRNLYVQVGRQGALNLTTIDYNNVDADVQRILESATGGFYDEFQGRAQPFAQVVTQMKSKSAGNVTEAGLESVSDEGGEVLVAVTVNTTVEGQPQQGPRSWRMRILVQKTGDDEAKVANVEFVP